MRIIFGELYVFFFYLEIFVIIKLIVRMSKFIDLIWELWYSNMEKYYINCKNRAELGVLKRKLIWLQ